MRIFSCVLLLLFASACTQKSQSEIAIEFVSTGNYELLSNEDRLIYTKDEAWGSLGYLDQVFDQTSKYFELEKFLIDNMSFKATVIKENEVVVTTTYPKLLNVVNFFQNIDLLDTAEKIENLYFLYQTNKLNSSDLEFTQIETTYKFTNSGIFLNLALKKQIQDLEKSAYQYTDMRSELNTIYYSTDTKEFNLLLEHSKKLKEKIDQVLKIKNKLLEIDPNFSDYIIEDFIEKANEAIAISRLFDELKNNIEYNDLRIAESTDGDLAIFGSYKYSGKENINNSHFIAKFFDKNGVLIGKQKLEYFARNLFTGKLKSFGEKIKDQLVAKTAAKIEIEPIMIF